MCHCLECQRRTGAVISNQARFHREQVTFAGKATAWMRTAESGNALTFHFCPTCGSTVYWEGEGFPGYVAVAIGSFADPNFPAPTVGVWEESRHPWLSLPPDTPPKRMAKQGALPSKADIRTTLHRVENEFQNGTRFERAITNFLASVPAPDRFPSLSRTVVAVFV
jgi:hypothetical protein